MMSSFDTKVNYKGRLQEYLQQSKEFPPKYTARVDEKEFWADVNFTVNGTKYIISSDRRSRNKKIATQMAAHNALLKLGHVKQSGELIKTPGSAHNIDYKLDTDNIYGEITVIIDYENYCNDSHIDAFMRANPEMNVVKYTSRYHPRAPNADVTVNSSRSDASDIKICCDVGVIFEDNPESIVVVVTRDHFASCLSDIYENCHHCADMYHCHEILSRYQE